MTEYPIAPNGIFWSIQGEGHLRGFQMAFIRLAGCSVGCPGCDTDYSVKERLPASEVAERADALTPKATRDRWAWITGGEPTDHDIGALVSELRARRFSVALATSGVRRHIPPVDWLSVSPHDLETAQLYGQEVKLCEGLNGLSLEAWSERFPDGKTDFFYRYVQPLSDLVNGQWRENPESLARCLRFLEIRPNWSLSRQDHRAWGVA